MARMSSKQAKNCAAHRAPATAERRLKGLKGRVASLKSRWDVLFSHPLTGVGKAWGRHDCDGHESKSLQTVCPWLQGGVSSRSWPSHGLPSKTERGGGEEAACPCVT